MATATASEPKPTPAPAPAPTPMSKPASDAKDFYGYLYEPNKTPTKVLDALLRAIALYIVSCARRCLLVCPAPVGRAVAPRPTGQAADKTRLVRPRRPTTSATSRTRP